MPRSSTFLVLLERKKNADYPPIEHFLVSLYPHHFHRQPNLKNVENEGQTMPAKLKWGSQISAKAAIETWLSAPSVQRSRKQLQKHRILETFRALANEDRILMVLLLLEYPSIPLREFGRVLQLEETTVSHHLHFLQQMGIITCHGKSGLYLCYSVNVAFVHSVLYGFLTSLSTHKDSQ